MVRPTHATWYVPRVSSPPALQALTCRLGAAARPCNVRACSDSSKDAAARATRLHYTLFFSIRDAKMGRPAHATWYVPRVSSPPALQALTCRLGAAARPCNVRAVHVLIKDAAAGATRDTDMIAMEYHSSPPCIPCMPLAQGHPQGPFETVFGCIMC